LIVINLFDNFHVCGALRYVGDRALLALLLDYDGTLSPIAPTPALATIPTETKKILERLSNHPDVFIAVISGRSVTDVKGMVGIEGITYAGNHGLEILHNDGSKFVHTMPDEHQENLASMLKQLHEQVCINFLQFFAYFHMSKLKAVKTSVALEIERKP